MLRTTALVLAALSLSPAAAPAQQSPQPARGPNVVFVMADDLGYRELGCFGQEKIATPRLDALAAEGMRLTRHYSGSPVCAPSRCVLMTGKHPGHAAVRDNKEQQPEGQWPLPESETTLGKVMQGAGYRTGGFGKWGLGPIGSRGSPLVRGFDHFFGYNCQRHAHSYWPPYLWDDDERIELANEPPVPGHGKLAEGADPDDPASFARFVGSDYAPDRILAAAKAFLRDNHERPFFLYYPSVIPHLALHIPEDELAPYAGKFEEEPYVGNRGYTTIVVFTSDNGATHSPIGGTDVDFFASCGELRGRKGSMYEGGVRVPCIVRWPGHVPPGSTSARVTGFEDWMPTLAELCSGKVPAGTDGISFAATLRGEAQPPRPFLYREFAGYGGWQAVWVGDFKLVRSKLQKGPALTELFDLAADPSEQHDLADEQQNRTAELAAIFAREHVASPTFPLKTLDGK